MVTLAHPQLQSHRRNRTLDFIAAHTVFATPVEVLAALGVLLLSSVVYTLFGFGSGLISVGLLALFLPVQDVVVLILLFNIPIELWVLAHSYRQLPWRRIVILIIAMTPLVPVGSYLLQVVEPMHLILALGAVLVVAGGLFLATPQRAAVAPNAAVEVGVGAVSGLLTGMLGTGGPPVILYFELAKLDKTAFRGALLAIFFAMSLVRIGAYALDDLITSPRLMSGALLIPAVIVGIAIGARLHVGISQRVFRRFVSIGFVVLGAMWFVRSI